METVDGTKINQRRHSSFENASTSSSRLSAMQRPSSTNLAIAEENENHEENGKDDDDDAGSKESFKENVINTNLNNDATEKVENGRALRRKSLAPVKHE